MTNGMMFLYKNWEYDVPDSITPGKTFAKIIDL